MTWNAILAALGLGLGAGVIGGMFGIGGGLIMVPALALGFGFDLKSAIGTSLFAQLLPVGLLGVFAYWKQGNIDVATGLWMALGLFLGAFLGALLTGIIPAPPMKRAYGAFLVLIGVYFLISPNPPRAKTRLQAPVEAGVVTPPAAD